MEIRSTLRIFWISGLVGVLVDLDHPISYWITGQAERTAHIPLFYISIAVICGVSAFVGGFYLERILGRRRK